MRRKLLWVALLYFAEGMPFGLVLDNFPVYFRVHGVSLAAIGFLSLLRAPWWAKVFWSPLVDQVGERRQWIAAAEPRRFWSRMARPPASSIRPSASRSGRVSG